MSDTTALEKRLIDLEAQIALQNHTIDELSDTLREQWDQTDKLSRQVSKLSDRLLRPRESCEAFYRRTVRRPTTRAISEAMGNPGSRPGQRQSESKGRAFTDFAGDIQAAAHQFNQLLCDHQTNPGSFDSAFINIQPVEGLE